MLKLRGFFRGLGIAVQIFVLGELLFVALATLYSMQKDSHVFRYAGF